ncbi:MAG TPA: hypothetical protein VFK69_04010 [Candidatus Eisenbacteria bacterium]|nr:hypothetical protein [Candidatus Eisenbacteria bacterium]
MAERDPRIHHGPAPHGVNRIRAHLGPAPRLSDIRELGFAEVLPARGLRPRVALAQGIWYVATGLWPIADARSFQDITGPKDDVWLARTCGMLIALLGGALLFARARRRIGAETLFLGIASALALAFADALIATSGAGTQAYLFDAALEIVFAGLWAFGRGGDPRRLKVVSWNPGGSRAPRAGRPAPEAPRWR